MGGEVLGMRWEPCEGEVQSLLCGLQLIVGVLYVVPWLCVVDSLNEGWVLLKAITMGAGVEGC